MLFRADNTRLTVGLSPYLVMLFRADNTRLTVGLSPYLVMLFRADNTPNRTLTIAFSLRFVVNNVTTITRIIKPETNTNSLNRRHFGVHVGAMLIVSTARTQ
jgi:hypothetical protein